LPTATTPTGGVVSPTPGPTPGPTGTVKPTVTIDTPLTGALINVGDSVLVTLRLHDIKGIKSATLNGVMQKGSIDLGTFQQIQRYKPITIPSAGVFRYGLHDTTVRRYMQAVNPADTTLDSLIVIATVLDSTQAADTARRRINLVNGPKVSVVAPVNGDSIPAGVGLSVAARAQQVNGVARIDIRVQGEANWPTKLDTSFTQTYTTSPRDITFSTAARIPIDAPLRGKITVSATAVDVDRNPGSAPPVGAYVRSASSAVPRVTQLVPLKLETLDSVTVTATGDAITTVGLIIRDTTNSIVQRDTLKLTAPYNANVQALVPLSLPPTMQGQRFGITAFAIDQSGRVGYAVPVSRATGEGNFNNAVRDSTLVVYGRTYALPQQGIIGDVALDAARGNVFLSNTAFNLLDVWQTSATGKGFAPTGIAVGSLPWGLAISNNPDTLLVANSGGTNISRVFIGSTIASALREDLPNRILTRNTYVYTVTIQRDQNTGKIRMTSQGPISYSDRPEYLAQTRGGRIFFSTRPTASSPVGTLRWIDPALPVPDPRMVWQYGSMTNSTDQTYALFNVDSIAIGASLPTSPASDTLFIWDHPYGQRTGVIAVKDTIPLNAVAQAIAQGSDAEAVLRLDITSLPLTDTVFAAASANRNWVAFGEGHTTGAGRVMLMADSAGPVPNFFSPLVTISDLTDNASEKVMGLALDQTGNTVASHGSQAFFATVSDPFHLRLQGKYDSFDDGAGIAFAPGAIGALTPAPNRLAFVAAASGVVEIVDIAYYINRGKLQLKYPIYGPLRASLPMPGDPPDVVMKVFAVSTQGLIVIDLKAADIKPGP
jgi:hypothetical protein